MFITAYQTRRRAGRFTVGTVQRRCESSDHPALH